MRIRAGFLAVLFLLVQAGLFSSRLPDVFAHDAYKVNGVCTALTAASNPVIGSAPVTALGT